MFRFIIDSVQAGAVRLHWLKGCDEAVLGKHYKVVLFFLFCGDYIIRQFLYELTFLLSVALSLAIHYY